MMSTRGYVIVTCGLFSLLGCGQSPSSSVYDEVISNIPAEFHAYFPDYVPGDLFFMNFNEIPYSRDGYAKPTYYYLQCEISNIDSLTAATRAIALGEYMFKDSCNVVIYKFQNKKSYYSTEGQEWRYHKWIEQLKSCPMKYPIPNFLGLEEVDYIPGVGLSDDYVVYVIKSKAERIFSSRYYGPKVILPETWETGYSSGVCISERRNRAVYWLVIW